MRRLIYIIAIFLPGIIQAITPEEIMQEFRDAPGKSGGIYYAYPFTTDSVPPFPEGYAPVYISHYGRHGSRWAINEKQYPLVTDILEQEQADGNLTEEGEEVLRKVRIMAEHASGHAGELSPLGQGQHKAIARRMLQRTPELFTDSAYISALSSIEPRCIVSMAAFSESLKEVNPSLQITRSASPGDMAFIAYTSPEARKIANDSNYFKRDLKEFRYNVVPKERLLKLLFKQLPDFTKPAAQNDGNKKSDSPTTTVDADLFLKTLHDIAVTTQNIDLDVDLLSLFTEEELFAFWQCINYNMYVRHGNSPQGMTAGMRSARSLLDDIINRADSAMKNEGSPKVQLRFGHDTNLIRLLALMQLDGFAESESNPYKYYAAWQDYRVSPMGANLQLIFFRPEKKMDKDNVSNSDADNETLVLILHNERPVTVPIKTKTAPYYRWSDLKTLWSHK